MPQVIEVVPRGEGRDGENYNTVGHYDGWYCFEAPAEGRHYWVPIGRSASPYLSRPDEEHPESVSLSEDFVRIRLTAVHRNRYDWYWAWVIVEAPDDLWDIGGWWRRRTDG